MAKTRQSGAHQGGQTTRSGTRDIEDYNTKMTRKKAMAFLRAFFPSGRHIKGLAQQAPSGRPNQSPAPGASEKYLSSLSG